MTTINKAIETLNTAGQSIWYDNCSRDVLESGELKQLVEAGVSGLTSNPTIFEKAISGSDKYDQDIQELAQESVADICEELMIRDVGAAADLLLPCFQRSEAADGYASIEVAPDLANDTAATIAAAKRIWGKLNRPNVMIKIPATPAGIPAIVETLKSGIPVNVTLIFSSSSYEKVANAYLEALEARQDAGLSNEKIASVASFFVSRVDSIVEKTVQAKVDQGELSKSDFEQISGKTGIANSRKAYELFETKFNDARFHRLSESKAQVQRPLWASTSTKNPSFPPLLYVEALAGKETVNTLPPATLNALLASDTPEANLHAAGGDYENALNFLARWDISLDELLEQLLAQGVQSFTDSYTSLLQALEQKQKGFS